jgi:hypothetical protein
VSIVVHRSDEARLRATVASLARACQRLAAEFGMPARLTIVDNAALEAPLLAVPAGEPERAAFEAVRYVPMDGNPGYGAGHNRALAEDCGEYHLVLNPDVELDADALGTGIRYLQQHPRVAGVVPEGRDEAGEPLYLAKREPSLLVLVLRAFAPPAIRSRFGRAMARYEMRDVCALGEAAEVPLASGCFMLLRGEALFAVGGFCTDYFLYFEDFDLSQRLRRIGPLVYLPAMHIVHYGGGAARKGMRHIAWFCRSALRYFSAWGWRLL